MEAVTVEALSVSVEDASRMLGVSRTTIYALIRSGQLPSVTIGTARRVTVDALKEFLAERQAVAGEDAAKRSAEARS